jgi:Domain of unknown function (DUF1707)
MSTQSQSNPRGRGYARSWMYGQADQHIRVSDAERSEVTDKLAQHFADGRLDQAEFDERVARAMSAKTRADLNGLFDDLPGTGAPTGSDTGRGQGSFADTGYAGPSGWRRGRRRHPILAVALFIFVAWVALHIVGAALSWGFWPWAFGPWLWLFGIFALVVLVARRRRF